jgi:hypothetical protein
MTLENLVNVNYRLLENDPDLTRLPFPHMFFEFENGLRYKRVDSGREDSFWINGLFFTQLDRLQVNPGLLRLIPEDRWEMRGFSVLSFGNNNDGIADGPFHRAYFFDQAKEIFVGELLPTGNEFHNYQIRLDRVYSSEEIQSMTELDPRLFTSQIEEGDFLDHRKMPNLVINILDLIKAENVDMILQQASGRGVGARARARNPATPLRQYYTIEIKSRTVYSRPEEPGTGTPLTYRVWVMGHSQKYHTSQGIIRRYVNFYIKGPRNAPWKNNRYLMLYKNFRQRLDSRGDEDIGTSLES